MTPILARQSRSRDDMIRLTAFALLSLFLLVGGMTVGAWFAQSLSIDDLKAGRVWASASSTTP
jgi:hypothetical protein